jgi:hypothetical protein
MCWSTAGCRVCSGLAVVCSVATETVVATRKTETQFASACDLDLWVLWAHGYIDSISYTSTKNYYK